jgi:hypothetical protein
MIKKEKFARKQNTKRKRLLKICWLCVPHSRGFCDGSTHSGTLEKYLFEKKSAWSFSFFVLS